MSSERNTEIMRLRHKYRRAVLHGKARVPLQTAKSLLGPDCAYHLYRSFAPDPKRSRKNES